MLNDHRMVDIEFFSNFVCSCKWISFDDCSQLVVVNFLWLATMLLIFKALANAQTYQHILESPGEPTDTHIAGPGVGLRNYISNKFLGDADGTSSGPTL